MRTARMLMGAALACASTPATADIKYYVREIVGDDSGSRATATVDVDVPSVVAEIKSGMTKVSALKAASITSMTFATTGDPHTLGVEVAGDITVAGFVLPLKVAVSVRVVVVNPDTVALELVSPSIELTRQPAPKDVRLRDLTFASADASWIVITASID